jgi:hypothetical protein
VNREVKGTAMNHYEQMIVEDTGCPPEEAYKVEAVMRLDVFHSTLDWQSRAEFRRGARKAWRLLNENRADYEEYFRQCRVASGLPPEESPPANLATLNEPGAAVGLSEDPPVLWERKQTILNLVMFREAQGERCEQGCRFHMAPCADGRWFVWAEVHQPPDDPEPCDAFYDFYNGIGIAFATREEALAAIYEYGSEFCADEAEGIEGELDMGPTP